jgi:hypothetical protein
MHMSLVTPSQRPATFPIVKGYQSSCPGCANTPVPGQDGFIAELNSAGNNLLYSTYFGSVAGQPLSSGSSNSTSAVSIALDGSGDIFFDGDTNATDLPTSSGAYLSSCPASVGGRNPCDSPYLAELNPSLTNQLVYSSFVSGTTDTAAATAASDSVGSDAIGLAVDSKGKAYMSGFTFESDFPLTSGVLNGGPCAAESCGFVAKFDTTQSGKNSLVYSTLVTGSSGLTELDRIAVDSNGDAYVTGATLATDIPVKNGYRGTCPDCANDRSSVLVSELNPTGSAMIYSTYLGGSTEPYSGIEALADIGFGIA